VSAARPLDALTASTGLRTLKTKLIDRTGLAYYADKDAALARAVSGRLAGLGLTQVDAYLERLESAGGEAEWQALIDEITIGETHFFRYAAQFEALRDLILPDCLARRRADRSLRIWSAGCASGPEPYSVALLLDDAFGPMLTGWDVEILGTDINRRDLARAERGEYSAWDLRDLPEDKRARWFSRDGKTWLLHERHRRRVSFSHQNLLGGGLDFARAKAGVFDVVLCRNVMIYFDQETSRRLLAALHTALADGGWLIVGHAEPHFEIANLFQPCSAPGTTLYRKQGGEALRPSAPTPAAWPAPEIAWPPAPEPPPIVLPPPPPLPAAARREPAPGPDAPTDRLAEVRRVANAGDWPRAEDLCRDRLAQDPLDAEAHYLLALVLGQRGDAQGSEASLKRAVYLDRHFALAHYHLGLAAAARGDRCGALRALRNAREAARPLPREVALRAGDGLSAAELGGLVAMQLAALEVPR
jgi:chemotaxis protein methyltransferase CheR